MNSYRSTLIAGYIVLCVLSNGDRSVVTFAQDSTRPDLADSAIEAVVASGPMNATVEQVRALVQALDQRPRSESYRDPDSGTPIKRFQSGAERWKNNLLYSVHHRFLEDGRLQSTVWQITRPTSREELSAHSELFAEYSPQIDVRPKLNARVISKDGKVLSLKPEQVFDQAADGRGDGLFDDRQRVAAILSGVEAGCIVESKVVLTSKPIMKMSQGESQSLTMVAPARFMRVVIEGDDRVRWKYQLRGPIDSSWIREQGKQRFLAELHDAPSTLELYEPSCDPQVGSIPLVQMATECTWGELGMAYAELVDNAIKTQSQSVDALVAGIEAEAAGWSQAQKIRWSLQTVQQMVRYTGLEFGVNAIVPFPPDQVIARRFGDCKDQSTLLVALLRKLGVEANVVLLRSSSGIDVLEKLPSVASFNHVIVASVIDGQQIFIDPTVVVPFASSYPLGYLVSVNSGRLALLCDAEKARLVTTPVRSHESNLQRHVFCYDVNHFGSGTASMHMSLEGASAVELGSQCDPQNKGPVTNYWQTYAVDAFQSQMLHARLLPLTVQDDLHQVAGVYVAGMPTQLGNFLAGRFQIPVDGSTYLDGMNGFSQILPQEIIYASQLAAATSAEQRRQFEMRPRRRSLVVTEGGSFELVYAVRFPADLKIENRPKNWSGEYGLCKISIDCQVSPVGQVEPLPTSVPEQFRPNADGWERLYDAPGVNVMHRLDDDDLCAIVRYRYVIRPGRMTAAEVNDARQRCRREMYEGKHLNHELGFNWMVKSNLASSRQFGTMRTEVGKAQASKRKLCYLSGVSASLFDAGYLVLAQRMLEPYETTDESQLLMRRQLAMIKSIQVKPRSRRILSNNSALKRLVKNGQLPIAASDLGTVLSVLQSDDHGLLREDLESHRNALRIGKSIVNQLLAAQAQMQVPQLSSQVNFRMGLSRLVAGEDGELQRSHANTPAMFLALVVGAIQGQLPARFESLDRAARQQMVRGAWELLLSAGRPEIAIKLQELTGDEYSVPIRLERPTIPKLVKPTEESSPELLAEYAIRRLISADVRSDVDELRELSNCDETYLGLIKNRNTAISTWPVISHSLRNRRFADAVATMAEVKLSDISPLLKKATVRYPSDGQPIEFWVVQDANGGWKPAISTELLGIQFFSHLGSGNRKLVEQTLKEIMPDQIAALPWFSNRGHEYARVWRALDGDEDQVEWTVRMMAVHSGGDFRYLIPGDQWLEIDAIKTLGDLRFDQVPEKVMQWVSMYFRLALEGRDYTELAYRFSVDRFLSEKSSEWLRPLLNDAAELRRLGKVPSDLPVDQWLEEATVAIESEGSEVVKQQLRFMRRRVVGQSDLGTKESITFLESTPDPTGQLPNMILWNALREGKDKELVREYVEELHGRFLKDSAAQHTLACAYAYIDELEKADEIYRQHLLDQFVPKAGALELLYGLMAESLGMNDVAIRCYLACDRRQDGDSATIARVRMNALGR